MCVTLWDRTREYCYLSLWGRLAIVVVGEVVFRRSVRDGWEGDGSWVVATKIAVFFFGNIVEILCRIFDIKCCCSLLQSSYCQSDMSRRQADGGGFSDSDIKCTRLRFKIDTHCINPPLYTSSQRKDLISPDIRKNLLKNARTLFTRTPLHPHAHDTSNTTLSQPKAYTHPCPPSTRSPPHS